MVTWTPDVATASVFATLMVNGIICVVIVVFFEFVRAKRSFADVFTPLLQDATGRESIVKRPAAGFLAWVSIMTEYTDDEIFFAIGMDSYVFLRFLRMMTLIGGICSCAGLLVLLPVYYTGAGNEDSYGINLMTMANIAKGSTRLWVPFFFTYIFASVFLYFTYKEYQNFTTRRLSLQKRGDTAMVGPQVKYTVQIENVPEDKRTSKGINELADLLGLDDVFDSQIVVSHPGLDAAIARRKTIIVNLENSLAKWESEPADSDTKTRPVIKVDEKTNEPVTLGACFGKETDAIEYWQTALGRVNKEVASLQEEGKKIADGAVPEDRSSTTSKSSFDFFAVAPATTTATAFITFRSRRSQITACQAPIPFGEYPSIKILPCPDPNDIIWANMEATPEQTESTASITSILYYAGLLFWGVIVSFVTAISSISNLTKFLPFIKQLDTATQAFIQGILPVLALIVLMAVLPMIIGFVSDKVEKRKTRSEVMFQVFSWFFMYQLANVFLVIASGSILSSLSDAIDNPSSIISLLGAALPTVSIFFLNFTLTSALTGVPLLLLRPVPFILLPLFKILNGEALTARTLLEGPLTPFSVDYGSDLPRVLYIVFIMQIYWVITPFLTCACTLCFGFMYLAWCYQFLFVVRRTFESGGLFWYGLYKYSMYGLVCGLLTIIGYMAIKVGEAQAVLLMPLVIVTIVVWRKTETDFMKMSLQLPYSTALKMDEGSECLETVASFTHSLMTQPNLLNNDTSKPYRLPGVPLLSVEGVLSPEYRDAMRANAEAEEGGTAGATTTYPVSSVRAAASGAVTMDLEQPLLETEE